MIWAIVSLQSCFGWLNRASPTWTGKNIINLISVLSIWWCPCVETSLVFLKEGVCCDQCLLLAKLCYTLPCFIFYSKAKLDCCSWCLLTFAFQSSMMKRTYFLVLVEGVVGLHTTNQVLLLWHQWLGHRLGLLWCWMDCLGNEPRYSVIFEIAPNYCISHSFLDYEGCSIPSKGFLPHGLI